ncbi:MAG: signal peptidase II [Alphaproteobacteria bacterium]|nr:signal peptidase II [Alphaproteobacteria bacterium]
MAEGEQPASIDAAENRWIWGRWSRLGLWAALLTLMLDQAHKWWMIAGVGMKEGERFNALPFLDIVYVKNTGISYSMFDSSAVEWQLSLAAFAVLVSAALWMWLSRSGTGALMALSLGLIIGGAIGNGIDRILLGGVADFFLLYGFGFSWYVFNIADIAIVAGVIGLLYDSIWPSRNADTKAT